MCCDDLYHIVRYHVLNSSKVQFIKIYNLNPKFETQNDFSYKIHEYESCSTHEDQQVLAWPFPIWQSGKKVVHKFYIHSYSFMNIEWDIWFMWTKLLSLPRMNKLPKQEVYIFMRCAIFVFITFKSEII